jgi:cytoskeletal protein CcmA (bactofilin family)
MFSKSSKKATSAITTPPAQPAPPSIISRDLKIVGDMLSEGEIQVDGTVDGDIRTRILIVGENGKIKGEIVAETVRILGAVDGQITAKVVILASTAHVVGDIMHEDLSIETGAFLEGHCKRMALPDDLHKAEKAKPTSVPQASSASNNQQSPGTPSVNKPTAPVAAK